MLMKPSKSILKNFPALRNNNLCCHCGTCLSICLKKAIKFDDNYFPKIDFNKCNGCGLCAKVCPGGKFDLNLYSKKVFKEKYNPSSPLGFYFFGGVGFNRDHKIKEKATSGGLVTAILIELLKMGKIKGAIVAGQDTDNPLKFSPIIARTKEEIINAAQGKYTIVPMGIILQKVLEEEGPFAFVGLPCHVQGLRKFMDLKPEIKNKIFCVLGLYCGRTMKPEMTRSLIRLMNISEKDVKNVEYRAGNWPGKFRVVKVNGVNEDIDKDIFRFFGRLNRPNRCLTCYDYSAEFADISFADAWMGDSNGYLYPGHTVFLARTRNGQQVMEEMKNKKAIYLKKVDNKILESAHSQTAKSKKIAVIIRQKYWRKKNLPMYNCKLKYPHSFGDIKRELKRISSGYIAKFTIIKRYLEKIFFEFVKSRKNYINLKRVLIMKILNRWFIGES